MAYGVYRSDCRAALYRTFNPLWGLFRGLLWLARIPFVVLGAIGFDAARAEGNALGKVFKSIFALMTATASLLGIE